MENNRLKSLIRIALIVCGLALIAVLFVPIWRIDLDAPQYPEGLRLLIYANNLAGNVDIINGLNHYIGMKTLHANDFIEFTVLPYIIAFYAVAFIAAGIIYRKTILYILFTLFVMFGVLAMVDFWRWEYDYGHNLNPDAAIVVPGMAYQPPLIGFKQLLNFGAYSMPDTGGWIFLGVGAVILSCVVLQWVSAKKKVYSDKFIIVSVLMLLLSVMSSCNSGPDPIRIGADNCYFCKMNISDIRFGAEVQTKKGKVYKFDDLHCLISYLQTKDLQPGDIRDIYFTNYCETHQLIELKKSLLLKSDDLRSPMGGNVAVFDNTDSLKKVNERFPGKVVSWNEIYNK